MFNELNEGGVGNYKIRGLKNRRKEFLMEQVYKECTFSPRIN